MAGERSWGSYADVHEEMQSGHLAASIIQAINRVCCRRVIDAEGNCPPAHIFVVLRAGEEGDVILGHIREEMPGVVVKPWLFELDGPQERIRRGSSHAAVLAFMHNQTPGKIRMSDIKKELCIAPYTYRNLLKVLRDQNHQLCKAL